MKKYLILGFALLALSARLPAQSSVNAKLSAAASTCNTTNACLILPTPNLGGVTFTVSANASSNTLQFEASADFNVPGVTTPTWVSLNATPSNSSTAASSTTGTGTWQANISAYRAVRIRMSSLVSGTSTVTISTSPTAARGGSGGGGGGLSGMTAGQVPIAATASTVTSSVPIQGTDTSLMSAGTVSGTSVLLCTDALGGSTTSGCPATAPNSPGIPTSNGSVYYATNYGAKFNGKACFGNVNTITVTLTSNQVSCTAASFTSADIGKQFTATNGCCGVGANYTGTLLFPNRALYIGSIVNSTTVAITQSDLVTAINATTGCTGATCMIAWATNDDTALSAAETAWGSGNKCSALILPAGITALLQPHFTAPGTNCLGMEPQADYTAEVRGQGVGATVLGLFPGFNFAACTAGNTGKACFGGYKEQTFNFFQFNGFGFGNTGAGAAADLIEFGLGSQSNQIACNAFGGSDSNLTGGVFDTGARFWGLSIDGCGKVGAQTAGTIVKCYYCFIGDTLGSNLVLAASTDFSDFGSDYGGSGGTSIIAWSGAATYRSFASNLFACGATNSTALLMTNASGAVAYIDQGRWNCASTTSNGAFLNFANQKLYLNQTVIGGTSANILRSLGTVYMDDQSTLAGAGANTSLAPSCSSTGLTQSACAAIAGSTNEKGVIQITAGAGASASGTATLTFAGTFSGPTGAAPECVFQYDNRGTGSWSTPVALMTDHTTVPTTSAYVIDWGATAPTNGNVYGLAYSCKPH